MKSNKGLQSKIHSYLSEIYSNDVENKGWVHVGTILRKTWVYDDGRKSYMPSYVDRELRLMEEKSLIARRGDGSKSKEYKYIPEIYRCLYIPYSSRKAGEENKLFKLQSQLTL